MGLPTQVRRVKRRKSKTINTMEEFHAPTLLALFLMVTCSFQEIRANDLQEAEERQLLPSPLEVGIRMLDEFGNTVSQSLQGLLGVTQAEKPQKMPKTPSQFLQTNSIADSRSPPIASTTWLPEFPTAHPALAPAQPPTQKNFFSTNQLNSPSFVETNQDTSTAVFNNANGILTQNAVLRQSPHLDPVLLSNPSSQQIFLSSQQVGQAQITHSNRKPPGAQNGVADGSSAKNLLTSSSSANAAPQTVSPGVFPDYMFQLQPPSQKTLAPGFNIQQPVFIETENNLQLNSAAISLISNQHHNSSALVSHPQTDHSASALTGEFSTFTNAQMPGVALTIPNSMLGENRLREKNSHLISTTKGKTVLQSPHSLHDHSHSGGENQHSHLHDQHNEHVQPHIHENVGLFSKSPNILTTEQLLSKLLASSDQGVNIPSEAVIHLNTGSTDEDTEALSFKEIPKRKLKQKLHFGGWVGVPQEKAFLNENTFKSISTSGSHFASESNPAQNSVIQHIPKLEPIFVPPTQMVPPDKDPSASFAGSIKNEVWDPNRMKTLAFKQHDNVSNDNSPSHGADLSFPARNSLSESKFLSAIEFLQKGSTVKNDVRDQAAHQKVMTRLRPHVQGQNSQSIVNFDPALFGVHQTLQPPELGNSLNQFRASLQDSQANFLGITLADETDAKSFNALLADDSITLEHDDDTGTFSFTQVIDNANPAQVEEAQQLITAIPAINISEMLQSDINSTHAFDTELILKSLLSFRKKPRRIQDFNPQSDFLQDFPNHLSPSVQLNSFVTPPSIQLVDLSKLNHFQNKQGPKQSYLQDLNIPAFEKASSGPNLGNEFAINRARTSMSNERRKRHETRFNKVNNDLKSFLDVQDEVWKINEPSDLPRLPSIGMSPPPLLADTDPLRSPPNLQLQSPPTNDHIGLQNSFQTLSPLVALSNLFQPNSSPPENITTNHNDGKQLLVPSVNLEPPIEESRFRITPKPSHQFGVSLGSHLHNVPTITSLNSEHVLSPENLPLHQIDSQTNSAHTLNLQSQTRTAENNQQNPLFQEQLANFPTIIVSTGSSQQQQTFGSSQNAFQSATFNQGHNTITASPSFAQNQFRLNDIQISSPNNHGGNNIIGTELISHQSGTHGSAFDFLQNPLPLLQQLPVSLIQSTTPRTQFEPVFQNRPSINQPNNDFIRTLTGVGGQFSHSINSQKAIGGNSIRVHDLGTNGASFNNQFQVSGNHPVENLEPIETNTANSIPEQASTFNPIRLQNFRSLSQPFVPSDSLEFPQEDQTTGQSWFRTHSNQSTISGPGNSNRYSHTSIPRFVPVGSNIDIKTLPSSLPGLTSNTVLGRIESNPVNHENITPSTSIPPWSRRFRNRFATTLAPAQAALPQNSEIDFAPGINGNIALTQGPVTFQPHVNVGLAFTPWPKRLQTTSSTTTTASPPVTSSQTSNLRSDILWPSFRESFAQRPTITTKTVPQPSSLKPEMTTTRHSIFDAWLRAYQTTTTQAPAAEELIESHVSDVQVQNGNAQFKSIDQFQPQFQTQRRKRRIRKKPLSRPEVPEYMAQETIVRPVTVTHLENTTKEELVTAALPEILSTTITAAPLLEEEAEISASSKIREKNMSDSTETMLNEDFAIVGTSIDD